MALWPLTSVKFAGAPPPEDKQVGPEQLMEHGLGDRFIGCDTIQEVAVIQQASGLLDDEILERRNRTDNIAERKTAVRLVEVLQSCGESGGLGNDDAYVRHSHCVSCRRRRLQAFDQPAVLLRKVVAHDRFSIGM
eukprot:CAMPEP_0115599920 /NCGR_PEP_ID=MMETSP0272-20121206/14631_1 /TAXON_ID=71861 /ORGANISM="Scrippsiella trochoidea, Strain CCMP3099" /LENGTH=134 /DNA_ID=CAMNT_0003035367 /DNA_START=499 /DNA_END=902 /DNA_ORIENTATION=-